jgi:hypothetical protein
MSKNAESSAEVASHNRGGNNPPASWEWSSKSTKLLNQGKPQTNARYSYADKMSTVATKSDLGRYAVGWICAISTEQVAAREFLDEEYGQPDHVSQHDNNVYLTSL